MFLPMVGYIINTFLPGRKALLPWSYQFSTIMDSVLFNEKIQNSIILCRAMTNTVANLTFEYSLIKTRFASNIRLYK